MKVMKNLQLILLALFFMASSCHQDDITDLGNPNELSPITKEGLNTYGSYINGELFLPKKNSLNPTTFPILAHYEEDCTNNPCFFYLV